MIGRSAGLSFRTGRAFGRTVSFIDVRRDVDDVTSGGASFVAVVQAADFTKATTSTLGGALHASGLGVFR